MSVDVIARSISRPVWELLERGAFHARVLAVFERACNLVTPDGHVVALVLPQVGDGPLNIVVDAKPNNFAALEPETLAWVEEGQLWVGELEVSLGAAAVWEPCPDWKKLRSRRDACSARLPFVQALSQRHAPEGSLLLLTLHRPGGRTDPAVSGSLDAASNVWFAAAQAATEALRAGWEGDAATLQAGAAQLAGLGGGLTPAGDDFLSGAMLWAWLAHPSPQSLCRPLVEVAALRTTALSAAFLHAAARGECSAAWHRLLAALSQGSDTEVATTVQEVLSYGATSGADALAGFLWAGLSVNER